MKHAPREDQEKAIQLALREVGRSNGCLIGDEPGFGKTTIASEIIVRAMREHGWTRVLLIGLPDTHKQWADRLSLQSDGEIQLRVMNGTKQGRAEYEAFMKHEPGVYIAGAAFLRDKDWESVPQSNPDGSPMWKVDKKTGELVLKKRRKGTIGPELEPTRVNKSKRKYVFRRFARKPLDAVIFDECQDIANRSSKTRQTILSVKANFRVAMSGTWFLNAIENMWSVARWVWPGEDPKTGEPYVESGFGEWRTRFLVPTVVYGKDGKPQRTAAGTIVTKWNQEKNPGEFVSTLPAYIRRTRDEVPQAHVVFCDPTPEQAAQIEDLKQDLMTWVMNWEGDEEPLVVDIPAVLDLRLRQVAIAELSYDDEGGVAMSPDAASAKLAPLRGLIDNRYAGEPVVIYTDSKIGAQFIAGRMRRAGYDARAWTGDLTKAKREELKQAFIAGEFPYLVVTIQSFGTGLDGFQKRANKVIWVSEVAGNPALNEQAIRRIFRDGVAPGFEHVKILMNGSVDVQTMEELLAKALRVRAAMRGEVSA